MPVLQSYFFHEKKDDLVASFISFGKKMITGV